MTTSAIFVDLDNVFGGLFALDPVSAAQIAQNPELWMRNLTTRLIAGDSGRRWLVRRCYLNPAGWVLSNGERLFFSKFRPFFVRAGFEVVDCPPLTRSNKNAADIRIVLDAVDVLSTSNRPDEIILASSDSDFTPLLHRIRSQNCSITLISTGEAAPAYRSLADQIIDAAGLLDLLTEEDSYLDEPATFSDTEPVDGKSVWSNSYTTQQLEDTRNRFDELVVQQYKSARQPINLARFSAEVLQILGSIATKSRWFGAGSFTAALRRVGLNGAEFGQHYLWDPARHDAPPGELDKVVLQDTIAEVMAVTDLPKLDSQLWPPIYSALYQYAISHDFSLTESSKWTRDYLAERNLTVGRNVINFVLQGISMGGASLTRTPLPTPDEISWAFFTTVLSRAKAAGLLLDSGQVEEIRLWLGADESGLARTGSERKPSDTEVV